MTRAELKTQAKALLKPQFGTVLVASIIAGLCVALANVIPVAGTIAALVVGGPLALGATLIYTTVTAGKTAKLEQLFEPFKTNFVNSFLVNLLSGLIIVLFSLLLIVPGIMKAFSYSMVFYIQRYEPDLAPMDVLRRSEELMKGHRMELFKLELSFIGWLLLVVVTFGLASFWVEPYMEITQTLFFDMIYGKAA